MNLPQLAALVHSWAGILHKGTREYYYNKPEHPGKETLEADIKNVREAIDILEQELQKFDVFIDTSTEEK